MKTFEVLIVGAGPAGCSTAYFLKHFDKENVINVDLVECLSDKKFERYHDMCGEGISNTLLEELYPLKPSGITQEVHTMFEFWPKNITIKSSMRGYLLDRSVFYNQL